MLIVVNGQVFGHGMTTVIVAGWRIERIGDVDASAFDPEIVDARGCLVVPGLIDCHSHLTGGSGERGWGSASDAISAQELFAAGITTVVGLLGTDTTTKSLPSLLAKVKALRAEGVNAWMWTGGYDARWLTSSVRDDIVLIEEIIGAGEIAIADRRGAHFDARALARLASDCYVAGTLTGKAGVLHLHTGELRERLAIVREVLDLGVPASALHPTHVNRNEELFREAVELTRRGVAIDLDCVEEDLARWWQSFTSTSLGAGSGDRSLVTISTDAPIGRVGALLDAVRSLPLEESLPLATANPARVLKLHDAGEIAEGKRADLLLLDEQTLALRRVIAGGRIVWSAN